MDPYRNDFCARLFSTQHKEHIQKVYIQCGNQFFQMVGPRTNTEETELGMV